MTPLKRTLHPLGSLLATAALAFAAPASAVPVQPANPSTSASVPAVPQGRSPIAARGAGVEITFADLDRVLIEKYAMSPAGRDALEHLIHVKVLDQLAKENRLEVSERQMQAKAKELEAEIVANGDAKSLADFLDQNKTPEWMFKESLRVGILHEELARRALRIKPGRTILGALQEQWLNDQLEERGVETPAPPWPNGIVATSGNVRVRQSEYLRHLQVLLPHDDLRAACRHLILEKAMRRRLSDVAPDAIEREIEKELMRREARVKTNPKFQGLTYKQIMGSRGLIEGSVTRDPELVATALTHIWVDRNHGEDGLREAYAADRVAFDAQYGEAFEVYGLFLNAAELPNKLNPRTFEQAKAEIDRIRRDIESEHITADHRLKAFQAKIEAHSQDAASRNQEGLIGWVTREDERVPEDLREAIYRQYGRGAAAREANDRLIGPLRLPTGYALVWVGARRDALEWDAMKDFVHLELRRRFTASVLPEGSLLTYID